MDSRCKQVSRLGFILPARLPAFAVAFVAFVGFTVTGIARKLHPIPMTLFSAAHFAQIHRLFICHLIIIARRLSVNSVLFLPDAAPFNRLTFFPVYAIIFFVSQKWHMAGRSRLCGFFHF